MINPLLIKFINYKKLWILFNYSFVALDFLINNYNFLWYYRHTKNTRNYQIFKNFDNNVLFGIYYSSNQVVMITDYLIAYTKLKFVWEV